MTQVGFYDGPGGVGVDFGAPGPYYYDGCGYYGCGGYYDYYGGPNVAIGGGRNNGWRGGWHGGHPHIHVHR
jgi:hypothetical protein